MAIEKRSAPAVTQLLRAVEGGAGKCAKHKTESSRAHDRWRGSSAERGYDHSWRKLRAWFLSQYPLCEDCEREGRVTAASHVDHRIAKAKGGTDDPRNLAGLCRPCHSRKTVLEDGGLGR